MTAKNYQIMNNEYLNTGGNCMVHITDVYNVKLKKMQYVFINEEHIVVSEYDYIRSELPFATTTDDFMLHIVAVDNLTHEPSADNDQMNDLPEETAELLFDCYLLFIRAYCKYTSVNYACRLDALPNELYDKVSREYSCWLAEKELDPVTDGYDIMLHPGYTAETDYDDDGKAAVEFKQQLIDMLNAAEESEEQRDKFYNEIVTIVIQNKAYHLRMNAAVWNGLLEYANYIINEQ